MTQQSQESTLLSGVGPYDVLCGRHKEAFNNIGNRRFRVTVSLALDRYMNAPTRLDKTLEIVSIIEIVQQCGGRFIKWESGSWVALNEKQTKEKVGHALRDMVAARERVGSPTRAPPCPPRKRPFNPRIADIEMKTGLQTSLKRSLIASNGPRRHSALDASILRQSLRWSVVVNEQQALEVEDLLADLEAGNSVLDSFENLTPPVLMRTQSAYV